MGRTGVGTVGLLRGDPDNDYAARVSVPPHPTARVGEAPLGSTGSGVWTERPRGRDLYSFVSESAETETRDQRGMGTGRGQRGTRDTVVTGFMRTV